MDKIQKILHTKGVSFIQALILLETLTDKLKVWRNELCDNVTTKAEQAVSITKRIRRKRTMPREYAHDSALTVCQEMRRSITKSFVKLSVKISSRFSNIKELEKRFGFLCKFEVYINDGDIHFKEQLSQINIKYTCLLYTSRCV